MPLRQRNGRLQLVLQVRAGRRQASVDLAAGHGVARELVAVFDLLEGHQLCGKLRDASVVVRGADHHRPWAKLRAGLRALSRIPRLHALARQSEDEGAEFAFLRAVVRRHLLGLLDAAQRELHPAHGAGLVVVPLGHHRMHAHELGQATVVDARRDGQGLRDGGVDVEVAAFEDRPCAGVALVEGNLELGEPFEGLVELLASLVVEKRADHRGVGRQARAIAEHVDDRDVLDQRDQQGVSGLRFGSLHRLRRLRPAVAVGRG